MCFCPFNSSRLRRSGAHPMLRSGPPEADKFLTCSYPGICFAVTIAGAAALPWRSKLLHVEARNSCTASPWPAKQTWLTRSTSAAIVTPYSDVCVEGDVCESRSFEKFSTTVPLLYCTCKQGGAGEVNSDPASRPFHFNFAATPDLFRL